MAAKGYVVWEGPSPVTGAPIVAVLTMKTSNRKTGQMAQLWIIPRDVAPTDALKTGEDEAVCGSCPLRGDGTGKGRACYVVIAQAPLAVWKSYRRGIYPRIGVMQLAALLDGVKVRLGAWGDPAMLPLYIVRAVTEASAGWTGYTHQWASIPAVWAEYLMASVDSEAERQVANALGWRCFLVVADQAAMAAAPHAVECMATRTRNKRQCADCLACSGTRRGAVSGAVDIVLVAHGAGAKYVGALASA